MRKITHDRTPTDAPAGSAPQPRTDPGRRAGEPQGRLGDRVRHAFAERRRRAAPTTQRRSSD